jgi:toxin-antitoxin system PIN domain toxin
VFVADTNVLVYAADDAAPEQEICRRILEEWRAGTTPWYVTWSIAYEFLRVVTHPRVLRRPRSSIEAWSFLAAVLASPSCGVLTSTGRHADTLGQVLDERGTALAGNILHDVHTAVLMREHGVRRIVTRDTDFHRFPFLEVVDPLASPPR